MSLEMLRRVKFCHIVIAAIALCSAISTQALTSPEQSVLLQNETSRQESKQQGGIASDCTKKHTQHIAKSQQPKATPLARALAQSSKELAQNTQHRDKTLTLEISELTDNSGLVYLGGKVSTAELSGYLEQLKNQLGAEQYAIYRSHQATRDQQSFHVTLINPYEYQTINKAALKLPRQFRVILHGLGRVETDEKSSYFVVASSSDGQFIRQNLLLNNKDFHVTLGFYPDDIYGVSKGRDTLIQSQQQ
jgi:hypothetical protein